MELLVEFMEAFEVPSAKAAAWLVSAATAPRVRASRPRTRGAARRFRGPSG